MINNRYPNVPVEEKVIRLRYELLEYRGQNSLELDNFDNVS
jgi:hypothetical protein